PTAATLPGSSFGSAGRREVCDGINELLAQRKPACGVDGIANSRALPGPRCEALRNVAAVNRVNHAVDRVRVGPGAVLRGDADFGRNRALAHGETGFGRV